MIVVLEKPQILIIFEIVQHKKHNWKILFLEVILESKGINSMTNIATKYVQKEIE